MSVKHRSPTTRLIILAAFALAAGLFALRTYDIFAGIKSDPVGGALEQELTYLLEPLAGPDQVRVSVTGSNPKSVLVMIDGDVATDLRPTRTRIETILTAAMAFDSERDSLTISQFPFARGVGASLTPMQIAELTSLGLLTVLLLAGVVTPTRQRQANRPASPQAEKLAIGPAPTAPPRLSPPAEHARPSLQDASALAESQPAETAHLVRNWMSYAED